MSKETAVKGDTPSKENTEVLAKRETSSLSPRQIGDKVIDQIATYTESGFSMPADYNYVNAIKSALMLLEGVKNKTGQRALDVCTQDSIVKALFFMVCQGLDVSLKQCFFVVFGNELQMSPSYFGKILQSKRLFPSWSPIVRIIYTDDVIETEIDPKTGKKTLVKHIQPFENMDKDFTGAYMYIATPAGNDELFMMTEKEVKTAWSQSKNTSLSVHQKFTKKMIEKTVINSGTSAMINGTPSNYNAMVSDLEDDREVHDVQYEEVKVEFIEEGKKEAIKPPKANAVEKKVDDIDEDF